MIADATFVVKSFEPAELKVEPSISTALPVGVAVMSKEFDGDAAGRSSTVFTAAFDQTTNIGTYVAMESFEGTLNGRRGAFNFAHAATSTGTDRAAEYFTIVPGSGTGDLAGIVGSGHLRVDDDGTHRVHFDYELG